MSGLTTFDAVYIALVFIVPGYVFLSLRNQFVVGQEKLGLEQVLAYLTLSGLNFALFGWMINLAFANDLSVGWKAVLWVALIVVVPAIGEFFPGPAVKKTLRAPSFKKSDFRPLTRFRTHGIMYSPALLIRFTPPF